MSILTVDPLAKVETRAQGILISLPDALLCLCNECCNIKNILVYEDENIPRYRGVAMCTCHLRGVDVQQCLEHIQQMRKELLPVHNYVGRHDDAGVIDAPFTASQFKLLPRVPQAIRLLNDLGLGLAIVSNQPGMAKGHCKAEVLKACERKMLSQIRAEGGRIDHIHYCLHHLHFPAQ